MFSVTMLVLSCKKVAFIKNLLIYTHISTHKYSYTPTVNFLCSIENEKCKEKRLYWNNNEDIKMQETSQKFEWKQQLLQSDINRQNVFIHLIELVGKVISLLFSIMVLWFQSQNYLLENIEVLEYQNFLCNYGCRELHPCTLNLLTSPKHLTVQIERP